MKHRWLSIIVACLATIGAFAQQDSPQWTLSSPVLLLDNDKAFTDNNTINLPERDEDYSVRISFRLTQRELLKAETEEEEDETPEPIPTQCYYRLNGGTPTLAQIQVVGTDSMIVIPVKDEGSYTFSISLTQDNEGFVSPETDVRIWAKPTFTFGSTLNNVNIYKTHPNDREYDAGTETGGFTGGWEYEWEVTNRSDLSKSTEKEFSFYANNTSNDIHDYQVLLTVANYAGAERKEWFKDTKSFTISVYPEKKTERNHNTFSTFEGKNKKATFSISENTVYAQNGNWNGWTFQWSEGNSTRNEAVFEADETVDENPKVKTYTLHYEYNKDDIEFSGDETFTYSIYKRPQYTAQIDGKDQQEVSLVRGDKITLSYLLDPNTKHNDIADAQPRWSNNSTLSELEYEAENNTNQDKTEEVSVTITNGFESEYTDTVRTTLRYKITTGPQYSARADNPEEKIFSGNSHTMSITTSKGYDDQNWHYQWFTVEGNESTEIPGETGQTYTKLASELLNETTEDQVHQFKAKVSFVANDNKGVEKTFWEEDKFFTVTVFANPRIENVTDNVPTTAGNVPTTHIITKGGGAPESNYWNFVIAENGKNGMNASVRKVGNNAEVTIAYTYAEGDAPKEDSVRVAAINTYNGDQRTDTTTIKATIYPQAKVKWNDNFTRLPNYYYGSPIELQLDTIGGFPGGWNIGWQDNGPIGASYVSVDTESKNKAVITVPASGTESSHNYTLSIPVRNNFTNGTNWYVENNPTLSFTAWHRGNVSGIEYGDSTDIYQDHPMHITALNTYGYNNGWTYTWTEDGTTLQQSAVNNYRQEAVNVASNQESETHTYGLHWLNEIEQVSKDEGDYAVTVTKWHKAEQASDFVITDVNRGTAATSGIREGNNILLSVTPARYGYRGNANSWHYLWNGERLNVNGSQTATQTSQTAPTFPDNNAAKATATDTYSLDVKNVGPKSNVWDGKNYGSKTLTVFRKPKTPLTLQKKGSGNSRTLIATTSLTDTELQDNEYFLVFAYVHNDGSVSIIGEPLQQQNPGQVRWTKQVPESQYTNDNNLCVYALWKYSNGANITSGLRFMGSSNVDEAWDGSDYSGFVTRGADNEGGTDGIEEVKAPETRISGQQANYNLSGIQSDHLVRGLNIVRMSDGTTRKVFKK